MPLLSIGDVIDEVEIVEGCFCSSKPLMQLIYGDDFILAKYNEIGINNYNCMLIVDDAMKNGDIRVANVNHQLKEINLLVSQEYQDKFIKKYYSLNKVSKVR